MAGSSQPGKVRVSVLSYSAPIFSTAMTSSNQSSVFSVHVSGVENQFLDKPVIIQFQNEGGKQGEPVCAYWVTHTRTWSRRGLKTTGGQGVIRCLSNHLTSFSVLFDPVGLEFSLSDDLALTTISQCLGIVSVICLVLTILVYALHPSLLDHSGSILLQLCLSLALLNSVVLVPSVFPTYQLSEQCLNLAIFIHYLTLVALCWMMVEAMNIFQRLVKVFATEESWFLRKRIALCWGAPMLLVGITFGAGYSQYISAVNIDSCVITAQQPLIYYLSFFGPGCVILLVNLTIFVAILRIVVRQRNSSLSRNQAVTSRQVIGVLTVMTLLGIGWLLGVLQVGPVRIFFAYLFVLVNGSQGVIIFIMRCLLHPPALHAIRKSLKFGVSPGQKSSSQGAASFSDSGRSWWKARFSKSSQSTSLIQDVPVDEASDRLKSSFRKSTYTVNP